jgi:hypothetical protein
MEAAKKEFLDLIDKTLAKHPSPKAMPQARQIATQLDSALFPFYDKVTDAIAAVEKARIRVKTMEPLIKTAGERVDTLAAMKGLGWKIFDNVLVVSDLALSFVDPGSYEKTAELLAGVGQAAASLAADKLTKLALEGTLLE